ncbi:MAG: hypothetical protein VYA69_14065 [Gemmatimonadota bacterium]|nr:hypothetical protein [Gemmatimonadota bacterium]
MTADTSAHNTIPRPLGAGGMDQAHLAEDIHLKRWVAIKVPPESLRIHPERLTRFHCDTAAVGKRRETFKGQHNVTSHHFMERAADGHSDLLRLPEGVQIPLHQKPDHK